MSLRASTGAPRSCSGDMYGAVPVMMPVLDLSMSVEASTRPSNFARPKSSTFTVPRTVSMMFIGLMSRWIDAVAVGLIQRGGDLHADVEALRWREPRLLDAVEQRLALDELHGDPGTAVLLTDLVDRADVGVIEGGHGPRLAQHPQLGLLVATHGLRAES